MNSSPLNPGAGLIAGFCLRADPGIVLRRVRAYLLKVCLQRGLPAVKGSHRPACRGGQARTTRSNGASKTSVNVSITALAGQSWRSHGAGERGEMD